MTLKSFDSLQQALAWVPTQEEHRQMAIDQQAIAWQVWTVMDRIKDPKTKAAYQEEAAWEYWFAREEMLACQ